ncbi:MAG: 30S ribosomal protein S20 [Alphaproteobacteria bacterium]|nr:30S ribosomal protein S20 [Alphaproteobacteria bacterium]
MANLKSAKTRVKRNKKRETINANRLNATRTAVKQTRAAIAKGDKETATKAFRKAESSLAKAKNKRTIKANTMARQISRLAQALKALVIKK